MDFALCLVAPFLGLFIIIGFWFKYGKDPELRDQGVIIIPPSDISPAVLPGLMDERYPLKEEAVAATIINLIAKGYLGIKERRKNKEVKLFGKESEKDLTILTLKKKDNKLKKHEKIVIEMIFQGDGKKVNLDQLMEDAKKSRSLDTALKRLKGDKKSKEILRRREKIRKHLITKYAQFEKEIMRIINIQKFFDKKGQMVYGYLLIVCFILGIIGFLFEIPLLAGVMLIPIVGAPIVPFLSKRSKEWFPEYEKWKSFEKSISGTLIKENPPSSVIIWERILAYATVLGKADKVMKHMNELKILPKLKIKEIKRIRTMSIGFGAVAARTYMDSGRSTRLSRKSGLSRVTGGRFRSSGSSGGGFRSGGFSGGGFRGGGGFSGGRFR